MLKKEEGDNVSISNDEYVKTLEALHAARRREEFIDLYKDVEVLLKEDGASKQLIRIYMLKALLEFQRSNVEELVQFVAKHLPFFQQHADEADLLRFKNIRALALDMIGYREGLLEQMLEMKAYGERHQNLRLLVTATINIGLLKVRNDEWDEGLQYFEKAYVLADEGLDDDDALYHDCCLAMNNMFATYITLQNYEKAAQYLHLEEKFQQTYPRYETLYLINVIKYYAQTKQFDIARAKLEELREEIEQNGESAAYMSDFLDAELMLAQALNDKHYEKSIYKRLISKQKKNNHEQMLQLIMQRSYDVKREELMHVAQRDPLTKLLNRRGYVQQTEQLKKRQASDEFIICAVLDIDHFKRINDYEGHLAGDAVIQGVATILKRYEDKGYVCARYGGDEFIMTFTANSAEYIHDEIKQLFYELKQATFSYEQKVIELTFTIGAIYVKQQQSCVVEKLLVVADKVMYEVKRGGRAYYVVKSVEEMEVTP